MPPPNPDAQEAQWLAAIADANRLAILRALTASELARACGVEFVNASHHVRVLKRVGLVADLREGRQVRYSLVGITATATLLELTHASGIKVTIPLG